MEKDLDVKFTLADFSKNHLPEVLKICSDELGDDYHNSEDFLRCIEKADYICKVAINADEEIIGFFMTMVLDPLAADDFLKLPDSDAKDRLLSSNRIGIFDSEAIVDSYERKGVGRRLIKEGYR